MLTEEDAHYLAHVLRMKPGQRVETFNGEGSVTRWEITEITRRKVRLSHTELYFVERKAPVKLTLALNPLKNGNEEIAIRMAAAMEVFAIRPVILRRSEVPFDEEILSKRTERWRRICLNEVALSGGAWLPEMLNPVDIHNFHDPQITRGIVFDEESDIYNSIIEIRQEDLIIAVVGPEGGFDREEITLIMDQQCEITSLGPWTLRAELAGALVPSWIYSRVT